MKNLSITDSAFFNNILYIGDEPAECINLIEKFNSQLLEIENSYSGWFSSHIFNNNILGSNRLRHYIKYHFEGGIAIFKFKSDDELPQFIKNECLFACKNIAAYYKPEVTSFS